MIKKFIGYLLLIHPLIVGALVLYLNLTMAWSLSENYMLFDFIYASISLFLVVVGLHLIKAPRKKPIIILMCVFFALYQVGSLPFKGEARYMSKVAVQDEAYIMLVGHSGGALSKGHVRLVLSKPATFMFRQELTLKAYGWSRFGELKKSDNEQLAVLLNVDGDLVVKDTVAISEIVL